MNLTSVLAPRLGPTRDGSKVQSASNKLVPTRDKQITPERKTREETESELMYATSCHSIKRIYACPRICASKRSRSPPSSTHLTPGKSFVLPPLTSTTACSCRLCPSPGTYAIVVFPVLSLTRTTFRTAEFGFFGLEVYTLEITAFFW